MYLIGYVVCTVIAAVLYYFLLPAFTFASFGFCAYVFFVLMMFALYSLMLKDDIGAIPLKIFGGLTCAAFAIIIIGSIISLPIFRANSYASLIADNIESKEIEEYTPTIDNVPLMDKATAVLLANRTMGSLVNEVSQYDLGTSIQINYQDKPIRVIPLQYAGFFKWINNKNEGIPSYITVDMTSQKTEIHRLENGMNYSPSGYFGDDLMRYLRFKYPTSMFGEPIFEIDDEGNPYWVVPQLQHRVGLFGGKDVKGIVVVDAIKGDITQYSVDDVPESIDNVYPTDILITLYNNYGKYQDGFLNSIFGQKGVIQTTEGYNYIPQDDDIWVYTGVTSVVSDESNVGFIYMNKRTKEFQYYEVPGAEEYSAMASAQGMVQNLGYASTFPLLLQIENQPTYCVALKDAGGLVKMYGLVNMTQYQIVVTGTTIDECLAKYRVALKNNGQVITEPETTEMTGIIEDIRTANKEGTTYLYIKMVDNPFYYVFSVLDDESIILANIGDEISFNVPVESESEIIEATLN